MAAMGLGPVTVATVRMVPIVRLHMHQAAAWARLVRHTAVRTAAGEAVDFMVDCSAGSVLTMPESGHPAEEAGVDRLAGPTAAGVARPIPVTVVWEAMPAIAHRSTQKQRPPHLFTKAKVFTKAK